MSKWPSMADPLAEFFSEQKEMEELASLSQETFVQAMMALENVWEAAQSIADNRWTEKVGADWTKIKCKQPLSCADVPKVTGEFAIALESRTALKKEVEKIQNLQIIMNHLMNTQLQVAAMLKSLQKAEAEDKDEIIERVGIMHTNLLLLTRKLMESSAKSVRKIARLAIGIKTTDGTVTTHAMLEEDKQALDTLKEMRKNQPLMGSSQRKTREWIEARGGFRGRGTWRGTTYSRGRSMRGSGRGR